MSKYWFEYLTSKGKIQSNINQKTQSMNDEIRAAHDLAKDPSSISTLTYAWVLLLSIFGGVVRVAREMMSMKKNPREIVVIFFVEMMTSAFAGILTFYLCTAADVKPLYTAVLTSMAGWMGVRALAAIETLYKRPPQGPLP